MCKLQGQGDRQSHPACIGGWMSGCRGGCLGVKELLCSGNLEQNQNLPDSVPTLERFAV